MHDDTGDLDYLEQADLESLKLPGVILDTMTSCIESGLCTLPIVVELGNLQNMSIKV